MKKDEFNPYSTLGVSPSADTAEIKRAYKKRVKEAHPDAGGTAEEFSNVGKAYRLLTDQTTRDRYDKTGTTEEQADNKTANAINSLGARFVAALGMPDIDTVDVVRRVRNSIEHDINELAGMINKQKTEIQKIERVKKRIVKKGKTLHDFVSAAYDDLIRDGRKKILNAEDEIATFKIAMDLLKDYSCKPAHEETSGLPSGYFKPYKPPPKNWNLS